MEKTRLTMTACTLVRPAGADSPPSRSRARSDTARSTSRSCVLVHKVQVDAEYANVVSAATGARVRPTDYFGSAPTPTLSPLCQKSPHARQAGDVGRRIDPPDWDRVVAGCDPFCRSQDWLCCVTHPCRRIRSGVCNEPRRMPYPPHRVPAFRVLEPFTRSGRQDLNLRPPGPQPERSRRTRCHSAL